MRMFVAGDTKRGREKRQVAKGLQYENLEIC